METCQEHDEKYYPEDSDSDVPTEINTCTTCKLFSRDQAKKETFEYIRSYYNGIRRHSTLGYKTPIQYERLKNVA